MDIFDYYGKVILFFTIALPVAHILTIILTAIGKHALCWIDDKEGEGRNPYITLLARKLGYREGSPGSIWSYYKKEGDERHDTDFFVMFPVFLLPMVAPLVAISLEFYPVALTILSLYLMAHMARYARRHKKLFDLHVKDKKAHE